MHLQQHAGLKAFSGQAFGQFYHGQFDNVGRRPLNRGVHSRPLGKTAAIEVFAVDVRQIAAPVQQCRHVAVLPRLFDNVVHVPFDARETSEVPLNKGSRLFARDIQILRKAVIADSVHDAEIDRLSLAPHQRRYTVLVHTEHVHRCTGVDVHVFAERLQQRFVLGKVCQHPQFNLRIVSGQYFPTVFRRDEHLPDAPPFLQPDRDVLQIRVGAAEPPCCGNGLLKDGVNFARLFLYHF